MMREGDGLIGLVLDRATTADVDDPNDPGTVIAQYMRGLTLSGVNDGRDDLVRRAWRDAAAEGR